MKKFFFQLMKKAVILQLFLLPLILKAQFDSLPNFRYYDKRGINVFEAPKQVVDNYDGVKLRLGAGFTQGFQSLSHSNSFDGKGTTNKLYALTPGFNTAMANLNIDVQLAPGIRLNLTSYLSTRHHNETWVKGGYLQIDKLPFQGDIWDQIMKVVTIKVGHMEINYGDAHFRRSDGGQTMYNPFVENYILDAYTTEIGGEIYARKNGFFVMGGISNGMIKGNVDSLIATPADDNTHKSPALYVKAGVDKSMGELLRLRLSGSYYHDGSSGSNTLFGGDRAGSNYFMVMEKAGAGVTYATNAFSGRLNPGFSKKVDAFQFNGFLKVIGLEVFATYEIAKGRTAQEQTPRHVNQFAIDWLYRFGPNENFFFGARYNTVTARLNGFDDNVIVDRTAITVGYFLTRNILLKGEIVDQHYKDFPDADYRNDGKFHGYVIHAAVGF